MVLLLHVICADISSGRTNLAYHLLFWLALDALRAHDRLKSWKVILHVINFNRHHVIFFCASNFMFIHVLEYKFIVCEFYIALRSILIHFHSKLNSLYWIIFFLQFFFLFFWAFYSSFSWNCWNCSAEHFLLLALGKYKIICLFSRENSLKLQFDEIFACS